MLPRELVLGALVLEGEHDLESILAFFLRGFPISDLVQGHLICAAGDDLAE